MDVSKATKKVTVEASLLAWLAVHGNLCLALRHPENKDSSRAMIVEMVETLRELIVAGGLLTKEEMDAATRVEQEQHGLERVV